MFGRGQARIALEHAGRVGVGAHQAFATPHGVCVDERGVERAVPAVGQFAERGADAPRTIQEQRVGHGGIVQVAHVLGGRRCGGKARVGHTCTLQTEPKDGSTVGTKNEPPHPPLSPFSLCLTARNLLQCQFVRNALPFESYIPESGLTGGFVADGYLPPEPLDAGGRCGRQREPPAVRFVRQWSQRLVGSTFGPRARSNQVLGRGGGARGRASGRPPYRPPSARRHPSTQRRRQPPRLRPPCRPRCRSSAPCATTL